MDGCGARWTSCASPATAEGRYWRRAMGKRKKRTYTAEQRAEAVKIALGSGKPISQAARDLDVGVSVLRHWIKQAQIDKAADPNGPLTSEERAELAKLRRDHKQLEQENAFLKKASAYFAKHVG